MPEVKRAIRAIQTYRVASVLGIMAIIAGLLAGVFLLLAHIFYDLFKSVGAIRPFELLVYGLLGAAFFLTFIIIFVAGRYARYTDKIIAIWMLIFSSMGMMIYYTIHYMSNNSAPVYASIIIFVFLSSIFYASSWGIERMLNILDDHKKNIDLLADKIGDVAAKLEPVDVDHFTKLIAGVKKSWRDLTRATVESFDVANVLFKSLLVSIIFFVTTLFSEYIGFSSLTYMAGLGIVILVVIALTIIDATRIEKTRKELIRAAV